MADICPACGQMLPSRAIPICSADHLVAAMRVPPPPTDSKKFPPAPTRDVYEEYRDGKVPTGRFYVTFGGGEATRDAVDTALRRGLIRLKYDFDGCWCLADG